MDKPVPTPIPHLHKPIAKRKLFHQAGISINQPSNIKREIAKKLKGRGLRKLPPILGIRIWVLELDAL
ncbi:hypothetical protein CIPAW_12G040900 [Carya illinoinensis]|uniref:Uncharacterized protein n=1 Tax=Carya illinoinensis TaxID=32201 RepID=A0A8T1NX94_CARIL|nr:hypothetical protein CIPAW_12G040900 [Carya illinoinensis]